MSRVATATFDLEADKSSVARSISGAIDSQKGVFHNAGTKLAGVLFGGFAAYKAVGIFKDSIAEAQEAAKVTKLTNAVLASTKNAAGIGAQGVSELANQLSGLSGIDDETIQSSENVLLTFTNVRNAVGKNNDIFNQGTKAALDMSAALGTDLQGATIQVGKALNDPIKGVTALQRVGVSFTASQKETIKSLVESGKTLEAQKLILHELGTEFGGAAAAAASPTQKLGVIWKNVEETIGGVALPILNKGADVLARVLPDALGKASNFVAGFTGKFDKIDENYGLFKFGAKVRATLQPLITDVKMFFHTLRSGFTQDEGTPIERFALTLRNTVLPAIKQAADWLMNNWPTALKIAGAAFLLFTGPVTFIVAAIALLYIKFQGVRDFVGATVRFVGEQFNHFKSYAQQVFPQVQEAIGHFINVVKAAWNLWGDDILKVAKAIWSEIQLVIKTAVAIVEDVIRLVLAVINGDWGKAWDTIKGIVGAVWNLITGTVKNGVEAMSGVLGAGLDALGRLWGVVWGGFLSIVDSVWVSIQNSIRSGANLIIDALNLVIKAYNLLPGHKDIELVSHLNEVKHTVDTGNNTGASIRAKQGGVGLAKGGNLSGWGTIDFVGEEGIELVSGNGHVTSNRDLKAMLAEAGGRRVNVEVSNAVIGDKHTLGLYLVELIDAHLEGGGARPAWAQ